MNLRTSRGRETLPYALAMFAAIGAVDHYTGTEYRVYPLYYLPIAYVGMRAPAQRWFIPILSTFSWALANALPVVDASNLHVWFFNTVAQATSFITVGLLIHRLRSALRAERKLSREDPLTNLANSRSFYETGGKLVAAAARAEGPLTLAYIDLDNFKTVNDVQGHLAGDDVLELVGAVLAESLRSSDLPARLGGDEFAILLPNTRYEGAQHVLSKVQERLHATMAEHNYPVTASIGAVAYERAPESLEVAVYDADHAMYAVKQGGKARLSVTRVSPRDTARPKHARSRRPVGTSPESA